MPSASAKVSAVVAAVSTASSSATNAQRKLKKEAKPKTEKEIQDALDKKRKRRGLTKPGLQRLARRAGISRLSTRVYNHVRDIDRTDRGKVLRIANISAFNNSRCTIKDVDFIFAMEQRGGSKSEVYSA